MTTKRLIPFLISACLLTLNSGAAADESLPEFFLDFAVSVSALSGTTTIELARTDQTGEYLYETRTTAHGIARLFRSGVAVESSQFFYHNSSIVPSVYHLDEGSGNAVDESHISFDWKQARASSTYEGESVELDIKPGMLDRLSADLNVILKLRNNKKPEATVLILRNDIKTYEFKQDGEEKVSTPAGDFKTVKFIRQRPGSRRRTLIWYAPELGYLPVKVQQQKEGKTKAEMLLRSYRL
jgi:hypothetical protein